MSKAFKTLLAAAILALVAWLMFFVDSKAATAIAELLGRLLLLAGLVIGAIKACRRRQQSGASAEELLLMDAGGAQQFLAKTTINLWFVRLLLLSPVFVFLLVAWQSSTEIALQTAAAIALPTFPIGLWAYRHQSRIKSYALRELAGKAASLRIDPYA